MAAPQVVKVPRPLAESPGLTVREFRHCLSAQRLRANGEQGSKEEDAEGLAERGDRCQPDRSGSSVGGSLTLAEVGRRFSAQRDRWSGPPCQPGAGDDQNAE